MAKLLEGATPQQIVALSVMGFAGIRAEELKRVEWQHFDFVEKHIIVPDSVAKCETRRIVSFLPVCAVDILSMGEEPSVTRVILVTEVASARWAWAGIHDHGLSSPMKKWLLFS
jgi:integrase